MGKVEDTIRNDNDLNIQDYIYFSPSTEEGEGEHKIIQFIQQNTSSSLKMNHVILGDDGDIIHLSLYMSVVQQNAAFYILRSTDEWIHIANLNVVLNQFSYNSSDNKFIFDFIFMCMLLGNDFLPRIPSLSIYRKGSII